MRVPDALPSRWTSCSSCCGESAGDGGDDLLADERRARLELALRVVQVEVAHGAHGVEADRGRAEDDDDEIGGVDTPEEPRPTHGSLVLQAIPHAAHRLDVRAAAAELAAQRDDVHVDRAIGHVAVVDE